MRKTRLGKTFWLAGIILITAVVVSTLTALAISFKIHMANEWQQYAPIAKMPPPTKNESIVVFAPHSDDETLGCGGYIATAKDAGSKIKIVLLTNGDGFRVSVAAAYKTVRVTPKKCVKYAYRRQKETLNALKLLGISSKDVIFLGYPDRGIAKLWSENWSSDFLYVSHATKLNRSPYSNSFTKNAPYCGESLLKDIEKVLLLNKPTRVFLPHPSDDHSDHYATYCFILAAVEKLQSEGYEFAQKIQVTTYLVHRGDWPCPRGYHPKEMLAPPCSLAKNEGTWKSLRLTPEITDAKKRAIKEYKTQTAIEKGFLLSFARNNEIFSSLPIKKVTIVPNKTIMIDGQTDDWKNITPTAVDAVGDKMSVQLNKGADIRAIYLAADEKNIYLKLNCVKNLSKQSVYQINFKGINETNSNDLYSVSIKPKGWCSLHGTVWAYNRDCLEMAIPLSKINFDKDLFLQVVTKRLRVKVDNTGWKSFVYERKSRVQSACPNGKI